MTGANPPEQVKVTVTSVLFHPAALASGAAEAAMVNFGAEKVIGMEIADWLPAMSEA